MKVLDILKKLLPFSGRSTDFPDESKAENQGDKQCHVEQSEPECHDAWDEG